MNRTLIRKTLFILALVAASAFAIVRRPIKLGLDLQGRGQPDPASEGG